MNCDCTNYIHPARYALGYNTCLNCGELDAREVRKTRYTVVPMHKQGYMAFSGADAREVVKQINPKRTC
jgi:hypothetical protein